MYKLYMQRTAALVAVYFDVSMPSHATHLCIQCDTHTFAVVVHFSPSQRQESWCPGSGGGGHDGGGFVLYNWLRATWLLGRWSSQWGECMHRLAKVFDLLTKFVTCSTTVDIIQLRVHDNVMF